MTDNNLPVKTEEKESKVLKTMKASDINVLMMGGRRAGKTSILAAMDQCCNEALATKNFKARCIDGGVSLTLKKCELENYFSEAYLEQLEFTADLNPSTTPDSYTYEVIVNGRKSGYSLCFTDVPGEYYTKENTEIKSEVQEMVNNSQIIIIAIDTPHLVEDIDEATKVGKYHNEFNRVAEMTRFLKEAFQESKEERMVLFVPLKCEKYFYRNRMKFVCETLKKGYSELFDFLSSDELKTLCTVGILPILTIGGAEFFKFNDNGYAGIYSYVNDPALKKYNPQFCDQPLYYVLYYLISIAERNKRNQWKITRWFAAKFGNKAKLEDFVNCKNDIISLMKKDIELGFEVLQDPLSKNIS